MGSGDGGRSGIDIIPIIRIQNGRCPNCNYKFVLDVDDEGCVVCGYSPTPYEKLCMDVPENITLQQVL